VLQDIALLEVLLKYCESIGLSYLQKRLPDDDDYEQYLFELH
jgi:hypothetical protein